MVDTSALCDADKTLNIQLMYNYLEYSGIKLLDGERIRPMNHHRPGASSDHGVDIQIVMAGVARTVQFTEPNDFLPVLRGLQEAEPNEVLLVNTMNSSRAVAGEIFCAEAHRIGLAGIIIDGPIRDTRHLSKYPPVRMYAASVSPYSGTTQSVGEMQQPIICGGVEVLPGEIVVGDEDGILVGSIDSFQQLLPLAQQTQLIESKLLAGITSDSDQSVASMTNYDEHLERRMRRDPSNLEFKV
jgi:regulator of RNase E activity RraA